MVAVAVFLLSGSLRSANVSKPRADCLIFVLKDCPIANQYMPEIKRIANEYTSKGIHFEFVLEDPDATAGMAAKFRKDFDLKSEIALDGSHLMARRFGATISPTAVVLSGHGKFYVGRIDDLYASISKRRPAATTHDLRDALDAVLEGKKIKAAKTEAVGCRLF